MDSKQRAAETMTTEQRAQDRTVTYVAAIRTQIHKRLGMATTDELAKDIAVIVDAALRAEREACAQQLLWMEQHRTPSGNADLEKGYIVGLRMAAAAIRGRE